MARFTPVPRTNHIGNSQISAASEQATGALSPSRLNSVRTAQLRPQMTHCLRSRPSWFSARFSAKRALSWTFVTVLAFSCSFIHAQDAFNTANTDMSWNEQDSQKDIELDNLNDKIRNALNANATDFCFSMTTSPEDILKFPLLNCTIGDSTTPNGYTASETSFALVLGETPFDYDSRVSHSLTLTAHTQSTTPTGRTANALTVSFNVLPYDEAPVFVGDAFDVAEYIDVNDSVSYSVISIYQDPEGRAVSIDLSNVEVCESLTAGVVGSGASLTCKDTTTTGNIEGDIVSTNVVGTTLTITADGEGITGAGVYYAEVEFRATDGTSSNDATDAKVSLYIKQGANNAPTFAGGATGFAANVNEVMDGITSAARIAPTSAGSWNANDLDEASRGGANHSDTISYSLVGAVPKCLDTEKEAVQIGQMCIALKVSNGDVEMEGYYLNREDPAVPTSGSITVTLRASDGWASAEVPIHITLNNINELYVNDGMDSKEALPMSVRLIEGKSWGPKNLNAYFTDPENDPITFQATASTADMVTLSNSTLTINGVGTTPASPNHTDTVYIEASDGTLQHQRTIRVEVRNQNTPPRFKGGILQVAGEINENLPAGTAVQYLVDYEDDDSSADEISVTVDSALFEGVVDPLLEAGQPCEVESSTCQRRTGKIALVTTAALNHESKAQHDVKLSLFDGWASSDKNLDVTYQVTVNDVNDPPTTVGEVPNQVLSVKTTKSFDANQYFADEDASDSVAIAATSINASIATVEVSNTGVVSVTGVAMGNTQIELTGTDFRGASVSRLVSVTVNANQAPVAQPDAFTAALPENLEMRVGMIHDIPLSALFSDPDGEEVSVNVTSDNESVVLVIVTSDETEAVATARSLGTATLTFTASDSAGNTTTETRILSVVEELSTDNQAPVLNRAALTATLPANNSIVVGQIHDITLTGLFTDPDDDEVTVSVTSSNDAVLRVAMSSDGSEASLIARALGSADLTITGTDTAENATSETVTITVVSESTENRAPVLDRNALAQALPDDNAITLRHYFELDLRGLFSDPDGDDINLAVTSSNERSLRVSVTSDQTSAFLIARAVGSAVLTISATDTGGLATDVTETIRVVETSGSNRPPVVDRVALTAALPNNNTFAVPEFFELELDQIFSDPDANDRVASFDASSSHPEVMLVTLDTGNVLTAFARSTGEATLTISATDTNDATTTIQETITVNAAQASSLVVGPQTMDRSAPLVIDIHDAWQNMDVRPSQLDISSVVGDTSIVNARVQGSALTLHAFEQGQTFVKLRVHGGEGFEARAMFFVDVVNAAPTLVAAIPDQQTTRVDALTLDVSGVFIDADNESLQLTAQVADASVVDITLSDGSLTIKGLQVGETTVTLTAVDTNGATTATSFIVAVENVAPSASASLGPIQLEVGGESTDVNVTDLFSDDGDRLTYSMNLNGSDVVQATLTDDIAQFTPLARGSATVAFTATDAFGASATVEGTINVGDDQLKAVASQALAGFGRSVLGSVSGAIRERARQANQNTDLARNDWQSNTTIPPRLNLHDVAGSAEWGESRPTGTNAQSDRPLGSYSGVNRQQNGLHALLGNGFTLNLGSDDDPVKWSAWSHSDQQWTQGESFDGATTNAYFGIDTHIGDAWMIGMSLTDHRGDFDYAYGTASRQMNVELNQIMPYVRFKPSNDALIWGTVGLGVGEVSSTSINDEPVASGLESHIAMIGGRKDLAAIGKLNLALRGDLGMAKLGTASGSSASEGIGANVNRSRIGFETSYAFDTANSMTFEPFGQINLRHDGGDGEPGSGVEITGGFRMTHDALALEITGRSFNLSGKNAYSEQGLTMKATLNPSTNGTGFFATFAPSWGADATRSDLLWHDRLNPYQAQFQTRSPQGFASDSAVRVDSEFGYGWLVSKETFLLTPYINAGMNEYGHRQTHFGAQLRQSVVANTVSSLRFAFGRTERGFGEYENSVGLNWQLSF